MKRKFCLYNFTVDPLLLTSESILTQNCFETFLIFTKFSLVVINALRPACLCMRVPMCMCLNLCVLCVCACSCVHTLCTQKVNILLLAHDLYKLNNSRMFCAFLSIHTIPSLWFCLCATHTRTYIYHILTTMLVVL